MIIVATAVASAPLINDIVEAGKGGTGNCFDLVIRNEKYLLPSHENIVGICTVVYEAIVVECFFETLESWKARPVLTINLFIRFPFASEKAIMWPDYFAQRVSKEKDLPGKKYRDLASPL